MQVKNGQELRLLAVLVSEVRGSPLVQKIDRKTGALTQTVAKLDSPAPVCIAFV